MTAQNTWRFVRTPVIGDIVLYTIGRKWGKKLLRARWVERRLLTAEKRAKIEQGFQDHGVKILLGVRLLPGIRGWVFVVAGSVRLPFWQFVLADAIYAIPLVNLMFWTAYWATDQIMVLWHQVEAYKSLVISHILAAGLGALVYHYLIVRRVPTGETPPIVQKAEAVGHAIESAFESAVDVVRGRHHDKPEDAQVGEKAPEEKKDEPAPEPEAPKVVPPG